MESAIIGFVLAIVVPGGAAIVWLTFEQKRLSAAVAKLSDNFLQTAATLTSSYEQLRERVLQIESKCNATETFARSTSSAALSGQLADLGADVAKLAASVRKQFGSVWAEMHQSGVLDRARASQSDVEHRANGSVDPELDAMLQLQGAAVVRPPK